MKLKKLYLTFICYLSLLAFLSIISIEVSSHSYLSYKKTEITTNKYGIATNLSFVFEEERDSDDAAFHFELPQFSLHFNALCTLNALSYFNQQQNLQFKNILQQSRSFITFRSLRI